MLRLKMISIYIFICLVTPLLAEKDVYISYISSALNREETFYEALDVISKLRDRRFIPILENSLKTKKSDRAKIKIIRVLGYLGDFTRVPELYEYIKIKPVSIYQLTPRERVRAIMQESLKIEAIKVLGNLRYKPAKNVLMNLIYEEKKGRTVDEAYISLLKLGEQVNTDRFVKSLTETDRGLKLRACEIMCEVQIPSAIPHLIKCLDHWDKEIRIKSAQALSKFKDPALGIHFLKLLSDTDPYVRAVACESLGDLKAIKQKEALKKMLKDEMGYVRLCAASGLLKLSDDSGLEIIEAALEATDRTAKLKALDIIIESNLTRFEKQLADMFNTETDEFVKLKLACAVLSLKK